MTLFRPLALSAILLAALLLCACEADAPPADPVGRWRVVLDLPGGELPVTLVIARDAERLSAVFINGEERVAVPQTALDGDRLELAFPAFNSRLDATIDGDSLDGTLTLIKEHGKPQPIALTATRGVDYRFAEGGAAPTLDAGGRWAVTFVEDDGTELEAVAEFRQQDGSLTGTFRTPKGDYRYLAGTVAGQTLALSTFDGAHAFLFRATEQADGSLAGEFWSGTAWHETWTAVRDDDAARPDAERLTFLKPGYDRVEFTFPDLDGAPVSLDDPRFAGKVVVVALAGTWCPNCHDEAAFLAPFYRANRDRGLEIVTLLYEHLDAFDAAAAQGQRFKEKHGIDYTLLIAGASDKAEAGETLPMLNHVYAYPTTLFFDRTGTLVRIHTGFAGPGTGEHYTELVDEFTAFVETLLDG